MLTALVVALGVVVALLGVLVAGLLRSHAEILRQLHALGAGRTPGGVGPVDVPFAALVALTAWFGYLAIARLPQLRRVTA